MRVLDLARTGTPGRRKGHLRVFLSRTGVLSAVVEDGEVGPISPNGSLFTDLGVVSAVACVTSGPRLLWTPQCRFG